MLGRAHPGIPLAGADLFLTYSAKKAAALLEK
jgi:delta-aminolevulinic acid dehydratase/porphobilinogen synthase